MPAFFLNQLASDLGAQTRAGAGAIGHVDAIDAMIFAELGAGNLFDRIDAARRQNFDERYKFPGSQFRAQLRFFRHRHFRHALYRRFALFDNFDDRRALLHGLERTYFAADGFNVFGRGATAAANHAYAGLQKTASILRHVFGRTQIDVAAFDGGG